NGVRGKGQGEPGAPADPERQGPDQDAPAVAPFGPALQEPPLRRLAANRRARVAHSVVGRTRPHRAGSSHKTPHLTAWVSRRRLIADFAATSGVVSGITKRLRPLPIGSSGHTLEPAVPRRDLLAGGSRMWSFAAVLVFAAATAGDAPALKKSCDKGDFAACHQLAGMNHDGEGVAKDLGKAAGLYKKACEGNHAQSCFDLAAMIAAGEGGSKDVQKIVGYLQRSCDGGLAPGCGKLGSIYD